MILRATHRPQAGCSELSCIVLAAPVSEIARAERRSGFDFMAPETRTMQQDDLANRGALWVRRGER